MNNYEATAKLYATVHSMPLRDMNDYAWETGFQR